MSNIDFEFEKNTDQYELVVENEIEHLQIDAKTEDDKATVDGLGEYELKIGVNTINLDVNAEDGTKKTYTINIKRKDNNASLSSLTISGIDLSFHPDILEYMLEVSNEIEKVEVEATAESELAKVEGTGEYLLEQEQTTIEVTVRAEDNTEKKYNITIKKKKTENKNTPEKKEYVSLIFLLAGGILFIIIISILVIILRKRKNNKQSKKSTNVEK